MAQTRRQEADGAQTAPQSDRLVIDCYEIADPRAAMVEDVRRGLLARPKTLPAKYLYDEVGSRLFDEICDQPEYYPTRTEEKLLSEIAAGVIEEFGPGQLVELGSGASRKTRILLDALTGTVADASYVPVDVSEEMLRQSATTLAEAYPGLRLHGIVGDYEHHLRDLPASNERMVIFLGSTIGNFTDLEARSFLRSVRGQLSEGDALLIGFDLVKPTDVLNAAYNDAAGVTAEFNRNVLRVLNRELEADFAVDRFEHHAFFNEQESRIEMHLRAATAQQVRVEAAELTIGFEPGESVRTEISRKFTRNDSERTLRAGGFAPHRWYESADGYFALALALAAPVV